MCRDRLIALDVDSEEATIESGLLIDTFSGIQVALVGNDDEDRAREGFDRASQQHRNRTTFLGAH